MKPGREKLFRRSVTRVMFVCADCLFLIIVGVGTVFIMHGMHSLGFSFLLALLLGMVVGMSFQTLASVLVAPVLGSLETMVPSMLLAMFLPMLICVGEAAGWHFSARQMVTAATAAAVLEVALLSWYSRRCRQLLTRGSGGL